MCLNRDADLKDCSNHPNATSPLLAKYFYENLLETDILQEYLTMITSLLNASPGNIHENLVLILLKIYHKPIITGLL